MVKLEDQLKCAKRELGMRKHAYPRWCAEGRMTQEKADREIAMMAAICDTLSHLVQAANVQPSLFEEETHDDNG